MAQSPPLFWLPSELTERILLCCHPHEVASFAETCRMAYTLVYKAEDSFLWRELFLAQPFDDLRKAPPRPGNPASAKLEWRAELQRRLEAESVVRKGITGPRLLRALETLVSVVETALPLSDGPDADHSHNLLWLDGLLHRARFDEDELSELERQLLGRLRTYLALTYETGSGTKDAASVRRLNEIRRQSRCFVYDLRKYTAHTEYGPFRCGAGGALCVDWEHMEHVLNVVALKLRELPDLALRLYSKPRPGLTATQAFSAPFSHDRAPHDWAGVAGVWRRFVCFMDYRDLFTFNYSVQAGPRDPSFFDDDYVEAIRPVELRLDVLDPAAAAAKASTAGIETVDARYPPTFFKGVSRGSHNSDAVVEGTVYLLADGAIRWTFVTKYDGLMQWSAEAVQVGNVCSAAGVAGIWTGAFHDEGDPAGPFWMWKVPAALPAELF
ncbi:uncharacterized protein FIBRA_08661 [Fibroporia radiculosa]|uniref:F-box domain-containing protein n=1 Tax=Fibroporia radiculosa TaxID=599839 RepID=J4ICH1_9APHY|nr:uncharacterized protein FIBRA_08661 [Fibroporia radiculosa]CCM06401.1 predicted protein [Fibroporia radiculosa]